MAMQVVSAPADIRARLGTVRDPTVNLMAKAVGCASGGTTFGNVMTGLSDAGTASTAWAAARPGGSSLWPGAEQLVRGTMEWMGWNDPCWTTSFWGGRELR